MKYKLIASGGTFDHFHKGHREFLKKQLELSKRILLGIASDAFVAARKHDGQIQNFETRKKAVEEFINEYNAQDRVEIVPIDTVYIPYGWNKRLIDAIFVTTDTEKGARLINKKRTKESLPLLEIVIVEHVLAEDGISISSHRIRNGEINREGKLYVNPDWKNTILVLPEDIRQMLKKPFGNLHNKNDLQHLPVDLAKTITVGDITAQEFNKLSLKNKISIIDFVVERKRQFEDCKQLGFDGSEKILKVRNPAGTIQPELFKTVSQALDLIERLVILVEGEEDLAVLVCILVCPLGYEIFYGQPQEGIVEVRVTEETKNKAYEFIGKFVKNEAGNTRGY